MAYASLSAQSRHNLPWRTVWYEDFSGQVGRGVNTQDWRYDTGSRVFGTGEVETMTSSAQNVHLDGVGDLDITARHADGAWTSGRIQTTHLFGAHGGGEVRVIASIKQPDPAGGRGYWPAFWLLGPGSWPQTGEIDVMEDVDALSEHSASFHCGNLTERNNDGTLGPCHEHHGLTSGLLVCTGCQTGYHTYSVIIDRREAADEQIFWYLDGREVFTVSESQVGATAWRRAVDHSFFIILDLAMGGAYPDSGCSCKAPTGQTTSGGTMSVRWVGVYRR